MIYYGRRNFFQINKAYLCEKLLKHIFLNCLLLFGEDVKLQWRSRLAHGTYKTVFM